MTSPLTIESISNTFKVQLMKIIKHVSLLSVLTITSIYLSITLYTKINALEFDTTVFLALLKTYILDDRVALPIVGSMYSSVCDSYFNCESIRPNINGGLIFAQFPPEYTSGMSLLFLPKLLDRIIEPVASNILFGAEYLLLLYCLAWAVLYVLLSYAIILIAKFKTSGDLIGYLVFIIFSMILVFQCSSYGVVGEFYASSLVALVVFAYLFTLTVEQKNSFYFLLIVMLGLAVEIKITIAPLVCIIFLLIACRLQQRSGWKSCGLAFVLLLLPRLFVIFYVFHHLDYKLANLTLYLRSVAEVYSHNYQLGLNWTESEPKSILTLILTDKFGIISMCIGGIYFFVAGMRSFIIPESKKSLRLMLSVVAFIILITLLYPLVFKFPYKRILTPFYALLPILFLPLIFQFSKLKLKVALYLPIIVMLLMFYKINPLDSTSFFQTKKWQIPDFKLSYPNIEFPKNSFFLISNFFAMPWDLYFAGLNDGSLAYAKIPFYSQLTLAGQDMTRFQPYLLTSCRWGHCNSESDFYIKDLEGKRMACSYIKPDVENPLYRLHTCRSG